MQRQFTVDELLCIGCGLCHERAPDNVEMPPGATAARVTQQPRTDEEEQACQEATDYCPTGGIQEIAAEPEPVRSGARESLDAAAS